MSELRIFVEGTPNPDAMKFVLDQTVQHNGSSTYLTAEEAAAVPMVKKLMQLSGVQTVFLMGDFVTVSKSPATPWEQLLDPVEKIIRESMPTHDPAILPQKRDASHLSKDERLMHIESILDREIRPGLAGDGGGLEVTSLEGNTLKVRYQGACGSCPSSTTGTLMAIQDLLRRTFDERIEVIPEANASSMASPFTSLFKNI